MLLCTCKICLARFASSYKKIEKIPRDEIKRELKSTGLSADAIEELLQVLSIKSLTKLEEILGGAGEAIADLKRPFLLAEKFGYSEWIQFDASVVRGLAYYTGIVFEGFDREGKLRAICGGGRYDQLLSTFGGDDVLACGFGFGNAVIRELPWGAGCFKNGYGGWNVNGYWLCEVHFRNRNGSWDYYAVKEESDPMCDYLPHKEECIDEIKSVND